MKRVKILIFKESGKYYTEEDYEIPSYLTEIYQIVEYVEKHFKSYREMHLVMLLDEFENGYPCMIPAERRKFTDDRETELAAAVGDYYVIIKEIADGFAYTIFEKATYAIEYEGVYMSSDVSIDDVLKKVVDDLKNPSNVIKITAVSEDAWVKPINYDELMYKIFIKQGQCEDL